MIDAKNRAPLLGMDLGTSTCLACIMRNGKPVFIQPERAFHPAGYSGMLRTDSNIMPSAFARVAGQEYIGEGALLHLSDPEHAGCVATEIKRQMGDDGKIRVGDSDYTPAKIAGRYVQVLRLAAERQLGLDDGSIRGAVVTVPASFGQRQIEATIEACQYGGLVRSQIHLIDEPVAAAFSLRLHEKDREQLVLVADLGGGTFDVALLRVGKSVGKFGYDELGRDGDIKLGGLDWDRPIAHRGFRALQARDKLDEPYVSSVLYATTSGDQTRDGDIRAAHNLLFEAAETAKKKFYGQFPNSGPLPPSRNLTRILFDPRPGQVGKAFTATIPPDVHLSDTDGLVKRCIAVCERMFRDVSDTLGKRHGWSNVDLLCLAGGGSYMATVRQAFAEAWNKDREPTVSDEPQHAVVLGAALAAEEVHQGRSLSHLAKRRYPHAVGVATYKPTEAGVERGFQVIVPRNAEIPFREPRKLRLPLVNPPGGSRTLRIAIEEESAALVRSTSATTTSANGHASAQSQANEQSHGRQFVKALFIELPAPIPGQKDEAVISVDTQADAVLRFRILCRGKEEQYDYDRDSPE